MKKIDLTGDVYGRLSVIADDGSRSNTGRVLWLCECSCGDRVHVQSQNLKNGRTKSCGCLNVDKKPKYLGSYASLEEATKIRREAEIEYGYGYKQKQ